MKSSDEEKNSPIINSSKTSTPLSSLSSVWSKNESCKVAPKNTEQRITQNREEEEEEEVAIINKDEETLISKLSQISPQAPSEPIRDLVKNDSIVKSEK